MILRFALNTSGPSTLTIRFNDLDLRGVNDPEKFYENLSIFQGTKVKQGGKWVTVLTSLTGPNPITNISNPLFTSDSNHDIQTLNLTLNSPITNALYLVLMFQADSAFNGTNTAEYLQATITELPHAPDVPTPLPGTLVLMGTVLAGSYGVGLLRRRRGRAAQT